MDSLFYKCLVYQCNSNVALGKYISWCCVSGERLFIQVSGGHCSGLQPIDAVYWRPTRGSLIQVRGELMHLMQPPTNNQ